MTIFSLRRHSKGLGISPRRARRPSGGQTGDTEAPSIPQNLVATAVSSSQIDLTWDPSTDNVAVVGYRIYRDNVHIHTSPTNAYSDTGLDAATEYEYEVSAIDAVSNESARSIPDSATTQSTGDTEAPSVPQNLAATAVSSSQIDLSWNASSDNVAVTGYQVYRDNVLIGTSPTNSFSDTGLAPGTLYQYEVSAFDAASNESARSAPASATTHYVATAVNFNGSTWLRRDAELTGAADSKVFSGSVWVRRGVTNTFMRAFNSVSDKQQLLFFNNGTGNRVAVIAKNAGNTIIFEVRTTNNDTLWHHYLWSVDLASTSLRHFYVDDLSTGTWQTYINDTIDFTSGGFGIGNTPTGASSGPWTGDMADMWLRFGGSVIDFSVEANRRTFITADKKPANPAGWPAGIVQLHGAVNSWHTNKGSGGGFNLTGTLGVGMGPVQA